MNRKFLLLATIGALFSISMLLSCNSGGEIQHVPAIDSVTGLDTNQVLISLSELEEQKSIHLSPFLDGAAMGYADQDLNLVIPAQYEEAEPFSEGLAVVKLAGKYGVIDKKGQEILPIKYKSISKYACGLMWLGTEEGFVLINQEGKRILGDSYKESFSYTCSENRIPVERDKKVAFFDVDGGAITDHLYNSAYRFYHGHAPVLRLDPDAGPRGWGVINRAGELVVEHQYRKLFPFQYGFGVASIIDDNQLERWGVIDTTGKVVIPFQYGRISGTGAEGLFVAQKYGMREAERGYLNNECYILDQKGNVLASTPFKLWDDFSEGLVVAENKDEKYGFANAKGELVIPFQYEWACAFSEGLAWVKENGKYGFINKENKFVIPAKYTSKFDYVTMEKHGVLVADPVNHEQFYLDKTGKEYRSK